MRLLVSSHPNVRSELGESRGVDSGESRRNRVTPSPGVVEFRKLAPPGRRRTGSPLTRGLLFAFRSKINHSNLVTEQSPETLFSHKCSYDLRDSNQFTHERASLPLAWSLSRNREQKSWLISISEAGAWQSNSYWMDDVKRGLFTNGDAKTLWGHIGGKKTVYLQPKGNRKLANARVFFVQSQSKCWSLVVLGSVPSLWKAAGRVL